MKINTNSLLVEATQIKSFTEKKKKTPQTCTLESGEILSSYSVAYLLSLAIQDKFKHESYDLINVRVYDPTKKLKDTITDEDVLLDDYLWMISNFISFCRKYHRVPRFITTKKSHTKVSFELYLYCLSKIANHYKQNNKLPNYCNFNKSFLAVKQTSKETSKNNTKQSTSTRTNTNIYVSKPHPTKHGCDGMGQNTSYYCGVSALQKCLFKFGITDFSQKTLASYAGTTRKGTSHEGIRTAVAKVNKVKGTNITVTEKTFTEIGGWKGIAKILSQPNKDIIFHNKYRLEYGHYEVMNQLDLNRNDTKVLNSLGKKTTNGCYYGYVEERSCNMMKLYMDAVSQKSLLILTKG